VVERLRISFIKQPFIMRKRRMFSVVKGLAWALVFWGSSASAVYMEFKQDSIDDVNSNTLSAVSSTQYPETWTTVTTKVAPNVWNSYRFTHWSVTIHPSTSFRDEWGCAEDQISFSFTNKTTATAHYLPASLDSNSDGVPDWYTIYYCGSTNVAATSDEDGDGFSLLEEFQNGSHPLFANTNQVGGISTAQSDIIVCNIAGYPEYVLRSDPAGTVDQSEIVHPGTVVTTPNMTQSSFGYWTLDGVQQRDALGVAKRQLVFTVENADREAVAYLFAGDTDSDGLPDAWEQYYFNTLAHDASDDLNGDGFTLLDDYQANRSPVFKYSFQEGGIAHAQSDMVVVNLTVYTRYVLRSEPAGYVNKTARVVIGTHIITPEMTQPTFAYWTLDGEQQRNVEGVALRQFGFTITETNTEAVAYFITGDVDNNGLPDAWEEFYFGQTGVDTNAICANGINTVLDAYVAGFSPIESDDCFEIIDVDGNIIQWDAVSNRNYSVYYSTNLVEGFQLLESEYSSGSYTDRFNNAADKCFYKVEVHLKE